MTIFSFIFAKQSHKNNHGYYINHDTLMTLPHEYRRRTIFYFIAEQTPEKLSDADRCVYTTERNKVDNLIGAYSITAGLLGLLVRPIQTATRRYYIMNGIGYLFRFLLFSTIGYNIAASQLEGRFVARSPVLRSLSDKYQFGVYDFALAKKESRLKSLKSQLEQGYFFI